MRLEGVENSGIGIRVIVNAFGPFAVLASSILLEEGVGKAGRDGLLDIHPDQWYPIDGFLRALKRIASEVAENVVVQVGQGIPKNAKFPPDMNTIEKGLSSIDMAYHLGHRKGGKLMFDPVTGAMQEGIGHFTYTKLDGKNEIHIGCDSVYPCAMDIGLVRAMSLRFQPKAVVVHEDKQNCRDLTGKRCNYIVTW